MSEPIEFAWAGTNEVAGVVNLHLYFFLRAIREWERAEALDPGLLTEPPGWREMVCAALVDADVSLAILLGQHSVSDAKKTPSPEKMVRDLLGRTKTLAVDLIKAAQNVRHFGLAKHGPVRQLGRKEIHALLEGGRHASVELLESKHHDASPWRMHFFEMREPKGADVDATNVYGTSRERVDVQIAQIQTLLRRHATLAVAKPESHGFAADLGHVTEVLNYAIEFLAGRGTSACEG